MDGEHSFTHQYLSRGLTYFADFDVLVRCMSPENAKLSKIQSWSNTR